MDNVESGTVPENPVSDKDSGYIDIANVEVNCHILIKDKDTNEVLLNKRG